MLNGKFYTGLPAAMMDRGRDAPNRQRTNFFWPDESDMESASESHARIRNNRRASQTPEKTINNEVNPNDLHKKELSSKINLNDNLPAGTAATEKMKISASPNTLRPMMAVEKTTNVKRRDTFSSKIQFYDFDNATQQTPPRPNRWSDKNSNIDAEKNAKNVTKTSDKRISFTENKLRDSSPSAGGQGILKNNRTTPAPKSTSAKPPMKNLSKSKSMGDVSAQNNVKVITNNMKNISMSREHNQYDYDDHEDYAPPPRRQIRSPGRLGPQPNPRRSRPVTEYYDEVEDDYYYMPRRRSPGFIKPIPSRRTYNHYDDDHDFEDSYHAPRVNTSRQYYTTQRVERRMTSRNAPDYDDEYDHNPRFDRSRRSETPKRTFSKEFNLHDDHDFEPHDARCQSPSPAVVDVSSATNIDHNTDEGQKPNNLSRRNIRTPPNVNSNNNNSSRVQSRSQRHLVSNVAFWSDAETNNSSPTPRTIRNSAVMRVSVGLPDA